MFRNLTDLIMGRCLGAFGESAEYRPCNETPYAIKGIFNDHFTELDEASGTAIISTIPNLGVRLSDFESGDPKQSDKVYLTRTSVEYRVVRVERDGESGAVLILSEA